MLGISRPYTDMFGWVALATVAYLPAAVVPVGLQIVGPYLEDRTTLAVGRWVTEVLGGYRAPPGV
jgi:amidase